MRSVVQLYPGPPLYPGAVAQLGERLVCNQEATGSIPVSSTMSLSLVGRRRSLANDKGLTTNDQSDVGCQRMLASNIGLEEFWSLHTLELVRPIPAEAGKST